MAELVTDCPRCGCSKITFNVLHTISTHVRDGLRKVFEAFCECRHCHRTTIFVLSDHDFPSSLLTTKHPPEKFVGSINGFLDIEGYVSLKDRTVESAPLHVPPEISRYFDEGAKCMAVECFNAGGTMFRLCLDAATKDVLAKLPDPSIVPKKVRYSLGFRVEWLIENGHLSEALRDLAECVKEDGNDGAHDGTLTAADAEDLRDFTSALLERLYTEPAKLKAAKGRREARRASVGQ